MLRRSEHVCLDVGDLVTPAGGGVVVTIHRSKADQLGQGAQVCLAEITHRGVPIGRIVRRLLARCMGIVAGSLERPLLVQGRSGIRWGIGTVTERLRARLMEVMLVRPELRVNLTGLSSHSLRKGGATAAANAGVSEEEIKAHGRWKSDAVKFYIRQSPVVRMAVVGNI
jgi:hypothetical protein